MQNEQQAFQGNTPPSPPVCWLLYPGVDEPYDGTTVCADEVVILDAGREGPVAWSDKTRCEVTVLYTLEEHIPENHIKVFQGLYDNDDPAQSRIAKEMKTKIFRHRPNLQPAQATVMESGSRTNMSASTPPTPSSISARSRSSMLLSRLSQSSSSIQEGYQPVTRTTSEPIASNHCSPSKERPTSRSSSKQ